MVASFRNAAGHGTASSHVASGLRALLFSVVIIAAVVGTALAHAHLESASPAVDSTVRTAPKEVVVTLTERVESGLSRIEVRDASGKQVDLKDTKVSADDPRTIAVSLGELAPGTYSVTWSVTSVDTHGTDGSYQFTVKP